MIVNIENSVHPYPPGTDEYQQATIPGAPHVFLTFDPISDLETLDTIFVLDYNNVVVWSAGYQDYQLSDLRLSVVGPTVKIRLVGPLTDGTHYGYKGAVDDIMDVTGPFLVDTTNYQKWIGDATGSPGPYRYAGNRYMVFYDGANDLMAVYKSTDAGATWLKQVNSPGDVAWGYASLGSGPTKIRISYDSLSVNHKWVIGEWDMATETWTEITTHTDVIDTTGYVYDPFLGLDYVFYRPTGQGPLWLKVFDGAVWDSGTKISDNVPDTRLSVIGAARADELGTLHIVYKSTTPLLGILDVYYRQMDAAGSLTTAITLNAGVPSQQATTGRISFTGNYIVIPFEIDDPAKSGSWRLAAVYSGTDYHTSSPTFSIYTVSINNTGEIQAADGPGGLSYVWWIAIQTPGGVGLDQIEYVSFNGTTAGTIQVFHDELGFPSPANDISGQFTHDLAPPVWDAASEIWAVHLALEYNPLGTSDQFCTGFYWESLNGNGGGGGGGDAGRSGAPFCVVFPPAGISPDLAVTSEPLEP